MRLNKFAVLMFVAAVTLQAIADQQDPHYWMKKYPNAEQTKIERCLAIADQAYENAGGTQGRGDNGFAVLAEGTAWERCMEGE